MDRDIARKALEGLASDGRKTRVLDRLPKSAHPTSLMISIGMLPGGDDEESAHDAEVRELAGLDDDDDFDLSE